MRPITGFTPRIEKKFADTIFPCTCSASPVPVELEAVMTIGCDRGEGAIVTLPVQEVGIRDRPLFEIGLAFEERNELVRIGERQGVQQHTVDNRENRRVGPDTESQREQRYRSESRIFPQHAESITKVMNQCLHQPSPNSHSLGTQRHHGIDLSRASCRDVAGDERD